MGSLRDQFDVEVKAILITPKVKKADGLKSNPLPRSLRIVIYHPEEAAFQTE